MSKLQDIITTSRRIIYYKGYQATSVNDILDEAHIGKGQFYHYFSSKRELGLAVVDDLVKEWDKDVFEGIFATDLDPIAKLNKMLDRMLTIHTNEDGKSGCPAGNLAIEMSEHDETFRQKVQYIFDRWISSIEGALNELKAQGHLTSDIDSKQHARAIVSLIEGAILLMKSQKEVSFLTNAIAIIRAQYRLS
ncbi:TetR/AcrR family transcriptional repressor of nem operon [Paenibacillus rhizosphaerae]|uniref:TetR/AcrR family transcriptional repressor of nem operon n=1 Tax=Paenibacillus rhizosphaerae TaxID=297318 RepID=A0A839TNL2_9BACL|nr:TetR/AcrR family transcriptional regulator [Paenibacillus rhizosphaerae]MBB3128504.1 TetR/AcrR family transcriptional repressor of nem operon [Paenibacillus rhizosphaerae]